MKYPKDFAQVEKWATHSLRDKERVNKKSSFLPLLVQKPLQQIQIYDQTMVNSRPRKCSDSSENDSFEESDYFIPSDNSTVYSRKSHHNIDTFIDYLPVAMDTLRPPPSKTVSVTSSTLVHPSSVCDDDVDDYSTPCARDDDVFRPSRDLPKMYQIAQEQMSSSFRKTAKKPSPRSLEFALERFPTLYEEKSDVSVSSTRSKKGILSISSKFKIQ